MAVESFRSTVVVTQSPGEVFDLPALNPDADRSRLPPVAKRLQDVIHRADGMVFARRYTPLASLRTSTYHRRARDCQ
jgi:NAD(P)H-dependent FMN reductase